MRPIGFSTGCVREYFTPDQAVTELSKFACTAIELGFVKIERIKAGYLEKISISDLKKYQYVSLHAPVFPYAKDSESRAILDAFQKFHNKFPLNAITFHPDQVKDFEIFSEYSFTAAFENMDHGKDSYKTPEELGQLLAKYPDFKAVIDTNHIYTNDPKLNSLNDFLKVAENRITHFHVSGYTEMHELVSETKQAELVLATKNINAAIICEGLVTGDCEATVKKELDYIGQLLS